MPWGDLDAHNDPVGFLALLLGGGRGTPESAEASQQQVAGLQGVPSVFRSSNVPHHNSGLFLKFKAEWINPIHRQTYHRTFILSVGLSFSNLCQSL